MAAQEGNLTQIQSHIKAGGKCFYFHRPADGATSLHAAARSTSVDAAKCVDYLFINGGSLEAKMITNHNTPLHEACRVNNLSTVQALLAAGSSFSRNSFGNTPLHLAVQQGNIQVALLLLEKKHPCDEKNNRGLTALHVCASLCEEAQPLNAASTPPAPKSAAPSKNLESYLKIAAALIMYGTDVNM